MKIEKKIFVVVDPNDEKHVALERCLITAKLRDEIDVLVFVCVDTDDVDTRASNERVFRDQEWFDTEIKKPLDEVGAKYKIEVSWCSEWRKAIVESAKRFHAEAIFLPVKEKSSRLRLIFTEEKWGVLKTAHCPVLLVRPDAKEKRETVLVAINGQAERQVQKELNEILLSRGHWMQGAYGADFHVVNAYLNSLHYPDRGKLVKETGLPSEKIHVAQGYTDEVVADVAEKIKADIVVIGTLGQNGMIGGRRGNTAERVISALNVDVMVVNHE
jgi:universal stress protein E